MEFASTSTLSSLFELLVLVVVVVIVMAMVVVGVVANEGGCRKIWMVCEIDAGGE
jgi:uncharacterized protein (UPF0333 family)